MTDRMAGGMGTTSHVLASMVHHLATTPGLRERITDPSLRLLYAEEIIRVFAPIVAVGRTATRDVEVAGTQMQKGDFVMLSQAAAAVDPRFVSGECTTSRPRSRRCSATTAWPATWTCCGSASLPESPRDLA